MVDPNHRHAWITVDHVRHPALVIEWTPTKDANGFPFWLAKCLYWAHGEAKVTTVPSTNVRKA